MYGRALHALLVARFEALVPLDQAAVTDLFRHDPDATDGEVRPNRSFQLFRGQLGPSESFTPLLVRRTFRLRRFYVDAPSIGDIIDDDDEQVMTTLYGFGAADHVDISGVVAMGDCIRTEGRAPQQLVADLDFVIAYTLTGG